jgi:uncharacterized damage-inducible protein DinB
MEHLDRSALLVLHNYNSFANDLVLKTASALDDAVFAARSSASHGSVQGLLTHMVITEFGFLSACKSQANPLVGAMSKTPTLQEITEAFAYAANQRLEYLQSITDQELDETICLNLGGQSFSLVRWQLLTQSLFHSMHHRGELSIVMTTLGQPLPTLDVIIQFVNESGQQWPWV